jgi:hypothetical protein
MRYAVVIENAGSNFSAYVPDLPGCVATGATLAETEAAIREAGVVDHELLAIVAIEFPDDVRECSRVELEAPFLPRERALDRGRGHAFNDRDSGRSGSTGGVERHDEPFAGGKFRGWE